MGPTGWCEGGGKIELLGQVGDAAEDGDGAQEHGGAHNAQANADHQVFDCGCDGRDDALFEALEEPVW